MRRGSWSWTALAAGFAAFDAATEAVEPPELVTAFALLGERCTTAAATGVT